MHKNIKTQKCAMDTRYKTRFSRRSYIRKFSKMVLKTRKNAYKFASRAYAANNFEFPKPLKLEDENSLEGRNMLLELPKPKNIKTELNAEFYLKARFQPIVRLKRLKNEELLDPFQSRYARRSCPYEGTKDFIIQNVYSLNPRIRLKRLKVDYVHSYHNEESLLNNSFATSSNNSCYTQNEFFDEMEFKYFTPEQGFSLFESSTPDRSSLLSNPADSGVFSTIPSTSHNNCVENRFFLPEANENQNDYTDQTSTTSFSHSADSNKTLLLKIAAERAFINNHLMHFGYSPVQFDLFNNPSELSIFLKYLFGNLNLN